MNDKAITARGWAVIALVALALASVAFPVSDALRVRIAQEQKEQESLRGRLALQLQQLRQDAATAQELAATLSQDDLDALLAASDRAALTAQIEPLAVAARLTHVTYTLAPAKPWDGGATFPGLQGITQSELSVEADAPADGDIFAFLQSLAGLSGRMDLAALSLSRLNDRADAPVAALNLHMKATLIWTANDEVAK